MEPLFSHRSFAATRRFNLRPDGFLYYLDNSRLMRVGVFSPAEKR